MTITQTDTVATTLTARSSGMANAVAVPSLKSAATVTTPGSFYDSTVNEVADSVTWNEFEIQTLLGSDYSVANLSACQSLVAGIVAPLGNGGIGRVRVTDGVVSKILKCDTTKRSGQSFREFVEYTEGSISRYLYDQVAPLFDATPDVDYFSTYNHGTAAYTRNAACWAASIDLSCVVVASNSGSGWTRQRGGVLIGEVGEDPEHILIARHFAFGVGTQVRFSNAAGDVETRTVIGTSAASSASDLWVCALSAPVTITGTCKIAGTWIAQDKTASQWYSGGIAIHTDQNAKIYAASLGQTVSKIGVPGVSITIGGTVFDDCETSGFVDHSETSAIPSAYAAMRYTPVTYDSGQPVFVIIDGEPVLLWTWTVPSGGTPAYLHDGAVLNALIVASNDNAVANGHTRPTDHTVTVAPDPTA